MPTLARAVLGSSPIPASTHMLARSPRPRTSVDPLVFAHRLSLIVWEICADRRPIEQITPWVTENVHQRLSKRLTLLRNAALVAKPEGPSSASDLRIGSHRAMHPDEHTLEFCATARIDGRTRAMVISVRIYVAGPRATSIDVI